MSDASIAIIGAGKVGAAFAVQAHRAGYAVTAVASRTPASAERVAQAVGPHVTVASPADAASSADLVLLTTPDDAIAALAEELARAGAFRNAAVVAHCSGALDSSVLQPAADHCGSAIGSLHPLHTFPTLDAALIRFTQAHCFYEGDARAEAALAEFARRLGLTAHPIAREAKPRYHAAAVLACNYLTVLMDTAQQLVGSAGVPSDAVWPALAPMVQATLDNIGAMGCPAALTGPIARGDAATVKRHLAAIGNDTELSACYRALGRQAVALAQRKGTLAAEQAAELRALLGA